ncbi:hypothetical protein H6G06_26555 [Anabaena sphaerica FACHB-251]|uniref:Uncharacterized protein n=1 Tax=Anabaena sphaerica FACHB-251 TaxID=2692883 RepID=A0A926WNC1_9NOST|nr:hypothetical protein [Anabaena sphaerica]MBD2296939.1 hypothetical protein [Anabaena sphaerica FACHB-251]
MNKLIFCLLTVSAIASAAVPANAGSGDSANIQTSEQTSIITGDRNYTNQRINQSGQIIRSRSRGGSGNVQDARQLSDIVGNDNVSKQRSSQVYQEIRRGGRRNQLGN